MEQLEITPAFIPTEEQEEVISRINDWVGGNFGEDFTLGGLAGTGKTTILSEITDDPDIQFTVLAPTGKAAQVLREKGMTKADTIHSFRYNYRGKKRDEVTQKKELVFEVKDEEDMADAMFLIVDEASMVNQRIYDDLSELGIPTLWVGDHGQLPPVGDDPALMQNLDARLETIHRTALESPILRLAHWVREGYSPSGFHGIEDDEKLSILRKTNLNRIVEYAIRESVDQILCGFNKTRHSLNRKMRERGGLSGEILAKGDRIICTLNNRRQNWFNGTGAIVVNDPVLHESEEYILADLMQPSTNALYQDVHIFLPAIKAIWEGDTSDGAKDPGPSAVKFDYGYAITTHKAQGSEFGHVLVIEEQCKFWQASRWRYTAYTRAKDRLTVVV